MKVFAKMFLSLVSVAVVAGTAQATDLATQFESFKDYKGKAELAAIALSKIADEVAPHAIPRTILQKAQCVATIPRVLKVAWGFGGAFGEGLVSCRVHGGGWSKPSYLSIYDGSFGFQIGVSSTDLVIVFMNQDAVEQLSRDELKLGVDAGVAAGPMGRDAQVGTDYTITSEIYSYSRSRGFYAGIALNGSGLQVDFEANAQVYGKYQDPRELLTSSGHSWVHAESAYVKTLERVAP